MTTASLYPAIRPSLLLDFANTKQLDPRVTFSRASTAVFYDGKTVAKAEENLFQFSQQFDDSYWTKEGSTIVSNTVVAPDGTSTAETLTAQATTGLHRVSLTSFSASTLVYTISVFAKKNTADWLLIREGLDGSTLNSSFDLNTGAVGTVGAGRVASIQNVGNGWYRCTTTVNASSGTRLVGFCVSTADNTQSYTAAGTESIYLWGAQLEQRSTVTAYTPTTTAPITNYIPALQTAAAGVPRFEHNPVTGESLGLEIEEQRTNLLTYSEQFDNAAWTKEQLTVTPNTLIAPDGTLSADKLVESTANSSRNIRQAVTGITSGSTLTVSAFIKAAERTLCSLYINDNASASNRVQATFDLSLGTTYSASNFGTFTGATSSITPVGNGWYRCTLSGVATGVTAVQGRIYIGTSTYTGNGTSGIYIWGAQLEAGAFPTSYIPTVASQVTRSADSASMTGSNFSSWYRADEGTVYAEASTFGFASSSNPTAVFLTGGAGDDVRIRRDSGNSRTQSLIRLGSATQAQFVGTSDWTSAATSKKLSLAFKLNDFGAANDGSGFATDTSGNVPLVTSMDIGSAGALDRLNGTIKRIAYYPKRLSNTELQGITS